MVGESAFRIFFMKRRARRRRIYGGMKRITIREGQTVSALGKDFVVNVVGEGGVRSRARLENGAVNISLAEGLAGRQRSRQVSLLAAKAISKGVMPDLLAHVNELNARHFRVELSRLALRDQKSRWGSYSKNTNSIYLNFRLLFAPEDVMDYVILHELAHIKELNHSRAFWALVGGAMPDYKEKRKWLRKNGNSLGSACAEPQVSAQDVAAPGVGADVAQ
jgi:Protein of unknown function DUF45